LANVTRHGCLERGHRPREPTGDELGIEDGPVPHDRESLRKSAKAHGEGSMSLPIADLTAAIACLDNPIRTETDQPPNAVDLRLDRESGRIRNGSVVCRPNGRAPQR
jgi:hypothetical protein